MQRTQCKRRIASGRTVHGSDRAAVSTRLTCNVVLGVVLEFERVPRLPQFVSHRAVVAGTVQVPRILQVPLRIAQWLCAT